MIKLIKASKKQIKKHVYLQILLISIVLILIAYGFYWFAHFYLHFDIYTKRAEIVLSLIASTISAITLVAAISTISNWRAQQQSLRYSAYAEMLLNSYLNLNKKLIKLHGEFQLHFHESRNEGEPMSDYLIINANKLDALSKAEIGEMVFLNHVFYKMVQEEEVHKKIMEIAFNYQSTISEIIYKSKNDAFQKSAYFYSTNAADFQIPDSVITDTLIKYLSFK